MKMTSDERTHGDIIDVEWREVTTTPSPASTPPNYALGAWVFFTLTFFGLFVADVVRPW
jgi:hypothetical protein